MTLLESLSAGCPTVATSVGGIKEIVQDSMNGLLARPEDPQDVAEKVLILLADAQLRSKLSKNAVSDSKSRYSPDAIAKQSCDYYRDIVDRFHRVKSQSH